MNKRESEREKGCRRMEREQRTKMGLIAKVIIILMGLIILLIGLNPIITVVNIIIKAVGVGHAHGAVCCLQLWIQTL